VLSAIAITNNRRYRLLPDVATFEEVGHLKFTTAVWFGLLGRAGGPADFLDAVTAASIAAHRDPQVRGTLMPQGYDMIGQVGADFAQSIDEGSVRWAVTVKATSFKTSQ
jgi:tripartite-type tricarboxylate transporter receptor subunit TctC